MEVIKAIVEFDHSDSIVSAVPSVIKFSREEMIAKRNESNHTPPVTRKTVEEQAREELYSGSYLGLEAKFSRIDHADLRARFGTYQLRKVYEGKDRSWKIYVL